MCGLIVAQNKKKQHVVGRCGAEARCPIGFYLGMLRSSCCGDNANNLHNRLGRDLEIPASKRTESKTETTRMIEKGGGGGGGWGGGGGKDKEKKKKTTNHPQKVT